MKQAATVDETEEYMDMRGLENGRGPSYTNVPSNSRYANVGAGAGNFDLRSDDTRNGTQSSSGTDDIETDWLEYMDMDHVDMTPPTCQVYDYVDIKKLFKTKFGTCEIHQNKKPINSEHVMQELYQNFTKDSYLTHTLQKLQGSPTGPHATSEDLNLLVFI